MKSDMEIPYVAPIWSLGNRLNTPDPSSNPPRKVENTGTSILPYPVAGPYGVSRLHAESDVCKGSTDTPQAAMQQATVTVELGRCWSLQNPL